MIPVLVAVVKNTKNAAVNNAESIEVKEAKLNSHQLIAFCLAAVSGFLLFASFPPLGQSELAFIALIPFVWALRLYPEARGRLSYLAGLVCWLPSLWFLSLVTIPGAVVLAAFCALYWIPAGGVWGRFLQGWQPDRPVVGLRFVLGGAAWWCALESLRGWLLTGFPWNAVGASQWENYSLIQLATLGGTLAVSFIVVTLNLGIALSVLGLFECMGKRVPRRMHPELYLPVLMLVISFSWGGRELRRLHHEPTRSLKVGVVQPLASNKWSPELAKENFEVLEKLSELVLISEPDLLIWPETAVPEELRYSLIATQMTRRLVGSGTPLLLGSLDYELVENNGEFERMYYNSAFMVRPDGMLDSQYRKKHLVMFGEYMPFANFFPFLRSLTPMPEDVTPGDLNGVLSLPESDIHVGILICFEDLVSSLARELAAGGADVLINQTNDAWFDPLWGSQGHLANAVFRSVEQRRPMVRATNSGVSAWINTGGLVVKKIEDPLYGRQQVRSTATFDVQIPLVKETTFYHRHPRAFVWACWGLSLLLFTKRPPDLLP
ncbi:apolipoprotein N-acyltransferase [Kiritimatiellota bacterium B12222]|nr:apolipoprotein N-acyltransferase [Kiritimatiellota bacterium B12222]